MEGLLWLPVIGKFNPRTVLRKQQKADQTPVYALS